MYAAFGKVLKADRRTLKCHEHGRIKLDLGIAEPVHIDALIAKGQLLGFDLLLRIDTIRELGGVYITRSGEVHFLEGSIPQFAAISIDEPNFSAKFDPHKKVRTASWKWANGHIPAELKSREPEYVVPNHACNKYKRKLQLRLDKEWLLPYLEGELGPPTCLTPLMAVIQKNKQKVALSNCDA